MSTAPNETTAKPTQETQAKQATIEPEHPVDARLRRLNDQHLPTAPYILSSPGSFNHDFVQRRYPQNALNWRKHSLFKPGEEELQYLTFKDRSEDSDVRSMYAKGGWDDGNGKIAAPEEPYSRTSSDATPQQGQAPKRKITLAEYQKKDRSKATTPAPKVIAPELTEGAKRKDKEAVPNVTVEDVTKLKQAEHRGQKRSADTMAGTKDSQSLGHPSSSTAAKKARTSPEPNTASPKTQENAASRQLEAKNSPSSLQVGDHKEAPSEKATKDLISSSSVKVPTTGKSSHSEKPQEKSNMPRLPPMLSPLSSVVEQEIVKMTSAVRNNKSEVTKSTSSVNSPSALPSKPEHAAPGKAGKPSTVEKPAAATKQTKSAIVAKGPHAQKSVTSAPSQAINNADVRAAATPKATASGQASGSKLPSTPTPKTTPPDGHKKMRLRVALKIKKKANRKNLHTYLSLKPTPGRNSLFPNRPIGQSHPSLVSTANAKTGNNVRDTQKADKVEPKSNRSTGPKTGEKRGRTHLEDDEPGPSTKRKSTARIEQIQKPSTPKSVPTSSPAMSQLGSAQKPSASTPGAQASSTAMQRALSGQGTVHTPQQSVVAGTPTAPTTGQRRRSYTSPDKPKSAGLRSESKHYQQVARTLKHEADKYLKKQDMMTEKEREQGLVIGTESVLCFMLAFVLLDTGGHYSDRASWNSILPFLKNLQGAAGDFPSLKHLSGLLCQLEGVIRDQVAYADLQQLDKNPVKHENENPSTQYTQAHCLQKANEYHKSFQEYHSHVMKAQSAWRLGWFKLNVARLPSHYPETWAKRDEERFAYGKGRDAVMRNEYTRKYSLPMGNMTSGLEAVNFGMDFLAEWTKTKGVEWEPKLVL